jgi:hypothetical protein
MRSHAAIKPLYPKDLAAASSERFQELPSILVQHFARVFFATPREMAPPNLSWQSTAFAATLDGSW